MKLHINSFDYSLKLPKNYLKVISKYAKNGDIKLVKNDVYETAIIEIDSLEMLPQFEKDLNDARGTVNSFDFAQIRGLIFSTIDEKEKIYEIDIYDFYNE